jgi:hypothetical protein
MTGALPSSETKEHGSLGYAYAVSAVSRHGKVLPPALGDPASLITALNTAR